VFEALNLVLNSVDLDGYGRSQRFVGYFEQSGKYKPGIAEAAVDFFLEFHRGSLAELIVVSSLHINSDEFYRPANKGNSIHIQSLLLAGILPALSYDDEFGQDYGSALYETAMEAVWREFKLSRADSYEPFEFRKLLLSKMLVIGLHGHCFLVSEKLGLAYYPHDYMGFGVVALRDDADFSGAHNFLRQAGALEDYFSVIET
jgi:hypothetical protein